MGIDLGHALVIAHGKGEGASGATLDEHDRVIAYILGLSHALNVAFVTAMAESGEAAPRLADMSSTTGSFPGIGMPAAKGFAESRRSMPPNGATPPGPGALTAIVVVHPCSAAFFEYDPSRPT